MEKRTSAPGAVLTPIDTTTVTGALNVLLSSRLEMKDLGDDLPDPIVLMELAKDLNNIATEIKKINKKPADSAMSPAVSEFA